MPSWKKFHFLQLSTLVGQYLNTVFAFTFAYKPVGVICTFLSVWLTYLTFRMLLLDVDTPIHVASLPRFLQKFILAKRIKRYGDIYDTRFSQLLHCYACGFVSYNPIDRAQKFCLNCGYLEDIKRNLYIPRRNKYAG